MTPANHPSWLALIGLSLMSSIAFLDITIVYTAIPAIQKALQAPIITLQWVMNIFGLVIASLMIFTGKLGDILGKRKVFFCGVILFGFAALGAGCSQSLGVLIIFRALQAVGAATIFTTASVLAPTTLAPHQHTKAIGIYSIITGLGLGLGPFIGGTLVALLSWRWIFFINIPLILIGAFLCLGRLREAPKQTQTTIDWLGLALLITAISSLVYSIAYAGNHQWTHPVVIAGMTISLIAFFALWRVEQHHQNPLLSLTDLKNSDVLVGLTTCLGAGIVTSGMFFLAPLYLSNILHVSPFYLGLYMLCPPAMQILTSALWNTLHQSIGVYKAIVLALSLALISCIIQWTFGLDTSSWIVVTALLCMGAIWGIGNTASITLTCQAVPPERAGNIIGLIFTSWNMSGAILLALSTTLFTSFEGRHMQALLTQHNISLTADQHQLLSNALSDPSRASTFLENVNPSLIDKLTPLFKEAFLSGYHSVMIFSGGLFILTLIAMAWLRRPSAHMKA